MKTNAFSNAFSGYSRDSRSPNHDRSPSADRSYSKQWPRNQVSSDHSRSPGSQDSARSHSNRSSDHSQRDRSRDRSGSSEKTSNVPNSVPFLKSSNRSPSRTANAVLQKRSRSKSPAANDSNSKSIKKGIFNHIKSNVIVYSKNELTEIKKVYTGVSSRIPTGNQMENQVQPAAIYVNRFFNSRLNINDKAKVENPCQNLEKSKSTFNLISTNKSISNVSISSAIKNNKHNDIEPKHTCSVSFAYIKKQPFYKTKIVSNFKDKDKFVVNSNLRLDSLANINWISTEYFRKLRKNIFIQNLDCDIECSLADKGAVCKITKFVNLTLEVMLNNGSVTIINDIFYVIASTFDLVIGWPCIDKYNIMLVNIGVQEQRKLSSVKFIDSLVEQQPLEKVETHQKYKEFNELTGILNKHHNKVYKKFKSIDMLNDIVKKNTIFNKFTTLVCNKNYKEFNIKYKVFLKTVTIIMI